MKRNCLSKIALCAACLLLPAVSAVAQLPKETALRTIRFWRMRRKTGDVAAA